MTEDQSTVTEDAATSDSDVTTVGPQQQKGIYTIMYFFFYLLMLYPIVMYMYDLP